MTLYVVLTHSWSGAETLQAPVLRADPDPLLACPPGSDVEAWARGLGVPTVAIGHRAIQASQGTGKLLLGAGRVLLTARELRRILRAHPERRVVVGTSLRPSIVTSLAVLGTRRRALWTATDLLPPGPAGLAIRLLARLTRPRVLCLSRYIADDLRVREALISSPGVAAPAPQAEEHDPQLALLVGHISPTKRTDLAVDIAERVGRRLAGFRLDIVGRAQFRDEDRALEAELRARVGRDPELARHVAFVGHDPDVPGRMRRAGLLLHCRADEPFGMVLIEAMAAGLPVVAPASGGPLEIVVDGETGLLYPPGDADAAAAAVIELARDPERARAMGEAGRRRVRERFSAERQAHEWLAFQRAVAGAQPASSA